MAEMNIFWKEKVLLPIDDLLVRVMGILRAEWWVSDEAFEHDGAERPPITLLAVALKEEDFGGDVIRRSNSRKGLNLGGEPERNRGSPLFGTPVFDGSPSMLRSVRGCS